MKRRNFILAGALASGAAVSGRAALGTTAALSAVLSASLTKASNKAGLMLEELHAQWQNYLPADFEPVSSDDKLTLSKDEWREKLGDPLAYDVLRKESTERPFTSPLDNEKREGVFVCAGCDLPLFTSPMKFDSGTGWPSFFTSIPDALETKTDFKMILPRTEYHCARCGGHQGHVFKDGPAPTGQRWCNNGVALKFIAKS